MLHFKLVLLCSMLKPSPIYHISR